MAHEIGIVRSWYDSKGFGFIIQEGVPGDVFVHHTQIKMEGRRALNPGQQVRFRLEQRPAGLAALEVEPINGGGKNCHACGQELKK